jgi:hypothetical protein
MKVFNFFLTEYQLNLYTFRVSYFSPIYALEKLLRLEITAKYNVSLLFEV